MNPVQRYEEVRRLYGEAEEMEPAQRGVFLEKACGDDEALRREVEELLRHAQSAEAEFGQLDREVRKEKESRGHLENSGDQIGRYTLIEAIGRGGFGTVWRAAQEEPVKREVALKILKVGMDTEEVVARFEAERQALALMHHPHIATVFDAGVTASGRPYFAMELVDGVPVTEFCDENRLSLKARLQLMIAVCHAVQHAHQRGIIHRDLKPSNILVSQEEENPAAKIIDFGIAKATASKLTDRTLVTQLHTFMGTPVYTSPEQLSFGGADVDTRTDIYSLGVILYELMTGRLPFDPETLNKASIEVMCRTLRESDPPRPSVQWRTLPEKDREEIARHRAADSAHVLSLLKSDLDWIILHCLEKDRTRRYETANALALDLEHYLRHEPVIARPPTRAYRLHKFVQRNRGMVLASMAVAATLVIGAAAATWQAIRATQAEHRMTTAMESERAARLSAEGVILEDHAKRIIVEALTGDNSSGLAHAIASLERGDTPARRRLALNALWKAPVYFNVEPFNGMAPSDECAFTTDGRNLITCSKGPEVLIWPSDGGAPEVLPGDPGLRPVALKLSPDGMRLLVTYKQEGAPAFTGPWKQIVWDLQARDRVNEWIVNQWGPQWFSPDGSRLLAYSLEKEPPYPGLAWWSIEKAEPEPIGSPHERINAGLRFPAVNFLGYSPSGNCRWLASWEGRDVYASPIHDSRLGKPVWIGTHDDDIKSVSMDEVGRLLASVDEKKMVLWSRTQPGEPLLHLPASWLAHIIDRGTPWALAAWPDANQLMVAYDLRGPVGARGLPFLPAWNAPGGLALHPNHDWAVLTGTGEFGSNRWTSLFNMRAIWPFHIDIGLGESTAFNSIRLFPDLSQVALINEGRIILVDLRSSDFPKRVLFEAPDRMVIISIEFDPMGEFLLVGTHRSKAWLLPLDGREAVQLAETPDFTMAAVFSPSGELMAAGGGPYDMAASERYARVMDREGRVVARMVDESQESVNFLKFLDEETLLIATKAKLWLWNHVTDSKTVVAEGEHGRIDSSEKYFVVRDGETVRLFDRQTLQARSLALDTRSRFRPVVISPDEEFVVMKELDGTLCVQYLDSDRYHLLPCDDGNVSDVWIDPDGLWIASLNARGRLSYWPVPRGEPLHDRPLDEFLAILKAQTNIRVVLDPQAGMDYRYDNLPFAGWETTPVWQEWYSEDYMKNFPWEARLDFQKIKGGNNEDQTTDMQCGPFGNSGGPGIAGGGGQGLGIAALHGDRHPPQGNRDGNHPSGGALEW